MTIPGPMHETGCPGLVHWDDLGEWDGEGGVKGVLLLLLSRFFRCLPLCNPRDGSPSGCLMPGILQARMLEWVAISFSNAWEWKVKVKALSRVQLLATPWTAAHQVPLSMGFSRQDDWSGVPLPSPRGFRMGPNCTPTAESCQRMAKPLHSVK